MSVKGLYSIREWAPQTDIMEKIPARINRGLFSVDLNITCVDAIPDFLALGSDSGIVFWYNRYSGEVHKLKAETAACITCLKIVNSVEFMVAAGHNSGQVSVFKIQKELPRNLNLNAPCTRAKPVELYVIRDLHRCAVTCCEWTKNGMKLYSGDRQGIVVLTELDYQNHLSKSAEILSEGYEIVQLSVCQSYLLVTTLYRSIVCKSTTASSFGDWKITQVGRKDRKQLVDCGGIFLKGQICGGQIPKLLCGRPGLRFWLADAEGNVNKTLLFKEAIMRSATWEIPILNPKIIQKVPKSYNISNNFGRLHPYDDLDEIVVTHDEENTLYILNLTCLRVEAVAVGLRKIVDMSVSGKEIFILEGQRSLLRLAPLPEKPNKKAKIIFNPSMPPPLPILGSTSSSLICESPVEYESEEVAVANAEECFELSPIKKTNIHIPIELAVESPRSEQNRRLEIFQQISDMDFDNSILHHSGLSTDVRSRRTKSKRQEHMTSGIIEIAMSAIKDDETVLEYTTNIGTPMEVNICSGTLNDREESPFNDYIRDILSPDKETVHLKREKLEVESYIPALQLKSVAAVDLSRYQKSTIISTLEERPTEQRLTPKQPVEHLHQDHSVHLDDAVVQTMPYGQKYTSGEFDFSSGEPIDDICRALCSKTFNVDDTECKPNELLLKQKNTLKFVALKSVDEDINSSSLDFNRRNPPPTSGDSNTSSEWEFLDN